MTLLPKTRHVLLFCVFLSLVTIGCSDSSPSFTLEDRDGVLHAINQGTNVWSDTASAPLQFELEQTYGTDTEPEEALLAGARGVVADDDGIVYVLDADNHRLVAFNSNGSVRWTAGREGEGPGEFTNAFSMTWDGNDRLFVGNNFGRQIDVWTTDGSFVERHAFENAAIGRANLVGYANEQLIGTETGFGDEPQQIHVIDPDTWSPTHSFEVDLQLDLPDGLGYRAQVTAIDDRIFLSYVTEYTLHQYTFDGTLTRRIHREVDLLTGPGVYVSGGSRMMSGGYSGLSAPVQFEDGSLLVYAFWSTNVDDPDDHLRRSRNDNADDPVHASVFDLFEPNGQYVGSLRWDDRRTPPLGRPVTVGPNGKLYTTTNDPFPQVRRYEVTVNQE